MANSSECTRAVKKLKVSDTSCSTGTASSELEFVTALATGSEHATTSSLAFLSERMESGKCPSIEEQIERSKSHWSELVELGSYEKGAAEIDNVLEFKSLQSHPKWHRFFLTFGDGAERELEVGKKFAKGGQAMLYEAKVKWWNPEMNENDLKEGREYVLKVFKKGTFLRH